jgi:hypothetical protein
VTQRFALRYSGAFRWLLSPLCLGPAFSSVDVDDVCVHVFMGWAFDATVPRAAIRSARRFPRTVRWTAGAHTDLHGSWLVNGAGTGIVEMRIEPAVEGRSGGFRIRPVRILVSLEDPDGFLRALGAGVDAGPPRPATGSWS